jgi:Uma2 family endonuclease
VLVVCDPSKITPRGCNGAPDLVVEVLSPSSTKIDLMLKYLKYEKAEVKEYWMVAPKSEIIDIATLGASKKYTITRYTEEDTIESTVLEGFEVTVKEIFSEMIRHES